MDLIAWCSHDAAAGYMIVLSSTLPGADDFDWGKFEEMPFTISLRSERLIYDMRLLPGCVCLTAGSAQQLQRHRQDFEREANHGEFRTERESALVDAVCIKKDSNGRASAFVSAGRSQDARAICAAEERYA